ncbi:Methyltransferase-like protein 2 [Tetrabaena socialis]|uniref:Methyltransferase-like protein 2 n=1 Tax=Tetrabaena socialis TaxID=47790 RepID=A0A2J8A7N8_9CHLO|nr:Methyltransferase-like protein 2 [Tetrabaena socialis]|eukprot:PNH08537.1 Methyltransferase-like protein 2 [Tetrabaena socialis]
MAASSGGGDVACCGYIGQGARPAAEYHERDFDWQEHALTVRHIVEAQQAQGLAQREAGLWPAPAGSGDGPRGTAGTTAGAPATAAATAAAGEGTGRPAGAAEVWSTALERPSGHRNSGSGPTTTSAPSSAPASASITATSAAPSSSAPHPASPTTASGAAYEGGAWEEFYRLHPSARFFKERRYLLLEFPDLLAPHGGGRKGRSAESGSETDAETGHGEGGGAAGRGRAGLEPQRGTGGSADGSGVPPARAEADGISDGRSGRGGEGAAPLASVALPHGGAAGGGAGEGVGGGAGRPPLHVAEIGCGCGSSILPVLKANATSRTTCTDISTTCLEQLRAAAAAEGLSPDRLTLFAADATDPAAAPAFEGIEADVLLIMFTLSAVPPEQQAVMLRHAWRALRPGGRLLIRDHGLYDMVQLRIPPHQWVGPNLYKRSDGTMAFFFSTEELADRASASGFSTVECKYVTVTNRNRRTGAELRRVFVHGVFERPTLEGARALSGVLGQRGPDEHPTPAESLRIGPLLVKTGQEGAPMALASSAKDFSVGLADLQTLFVNLRKYEQTFSPEAKQLFQSTTSLADSAVLELDGAGKEDADEGIAGYLATGNKTMSLRAILQQLQQAVSGFTSGSIPVPRSSKEELSRVHGLILNVKFALSSEQQLLITQLRKLCAEVESQKLDFDVIETNLDNTMRNVLQQVHGKTDLDQEVLQAESQRLKAGIAEARAAGTKQLEDMLTLAQNSLQRLHASHDLNNDGADESSDEEGGAAAGGAGGGADDEDDDDDPFFMPMPGAIKWAEASKFQELAKPLAPEQPADKQFMIVMEDDDVAGPSSGVEAVPEASSASGTAACTTPVGAEGMQQLSLEEAAGSPRPEEGAAAAAAGGAAVAAAGVAAGAEGDAEVAQVSGADGVEEAAAVASTSAAAAGDAAAAPAADRDTAAAAPADAASISNTSTAVVTTATPAPEKLVDFVNFLNGENPGACMFHAQMRLSPEGCMKLANFLRSSARVRALSLSHNYLGDAGLRLICDGLRVNKSVTALDLPDNNITDIGAAILAESIKDNPSLTQLQLAYNKIGDEGAKALAQVIRTSNSLKKLGLAFNNIGKAGCQALTSAISSNQSLKHMQLLPGNPVEEKDAKALAKALKRNNKFSIKQLLGIKSDN